MVRIFVHIAQAIARWLNPPPAPAPPGAMAPSAPPAPPSSPGGGRVDRLWQRLMTAAARQEPPIPTDLRVLDSGAVYSDAGALDYLWYELEESTDGLVWRRYHKAICLHVLTYLPREVREEMTLLQKMRKALLGLFNAQVDMVVLRGNLPRYGAVQMYGAQAISSAGLGEAVELARKGMDAVLAVMTNFEQSEVEPLDLELAEQVRRAFLEMGLSLVVVGHPDPREDVRGMDAGGADGQRAVSRAQVGLQQTEYLLRGMFAREHPFLNVVLLSRVGNDSLTGLFRLRERVARQLSIFASQERFTRSINLGVSLPMILSQSIGDSASAGYGTGEGQSFQKSSGTSQGQAHTEGQSDASFWSRSHTRGESWGEADSAGATWGHTVSQTESQGVADGTSHVTSQAHGTADTHGTAFSSALSHSGSLTQGATWSGSLSGILGRSNQQSVTESFGLTQASSQMSSHTDSHSWAVADGTSHTVSQGAATTVADSSGGFASHTTSHGRSEADTEGVGGSHAVSRADTTSQGTFAAEGQAASWSLARGQSLASFSGWGLAGGMSPFAAVSKTFQGEDHAVKMVADALRVQSQLLDTMILEGGYYVDNYFLCASPEAQRALEALIPQAYHGTQDVVAGVRCRRLTPREQEYIRVHAMTFVPSTRPETNPWALEPWKDTSLLTMLQAATYIAPAAFEGGVALTVREGWPPFAFVTNMPGRVVLGHQYLYENGRLKPTREPLKMAPELMSSWAFCADTRMGKSVAAERLVFDLVMQENYRVVVLDYGAGWEKMVKALPRDKVDYWSLSPWGPRPIRWNFLQIGKRIPPRQQMTATVELLCSVGRMGERQAGFMVLTLEELYTDHGVLTFDDGVQQHDRWGHVQDDEWDVLETVWREMGLPARARRRTWLRDLEQDELQALAVHRSKKADAREWFDRITALARATKDTTSKSALEGVRLRLQHLVKGEMGRMYGAGGGIAIESLAPETGGLTVLAGGRRMSAYAQASLLALLTYHLHTDASARREERLEGAAYPPLFIVIEEANKVLGGVQMQHPGDGPPIQSDIIPEKIRDAGKYLIFIGLVLQSPWALPGGVLSSCNNAVVGQLKYLEDIKVLMAELGKSPYGFMDVSYAHCISDLEQGQFIARLAMAKRGKGNYPILYQPLMVDAREPTRAELKEMFRYREVALVA